MHARIASAFSAAPLGGRLRIAVDTVLENMLVACTGYAAVSLQPNAGSQGEYAGLLIIQAYHASRGEAHREEGARAGLAGAGRHIAAARIGRGLK